MPKKLKKQYGRDGQYYRKMKTVEETKKEITDVLADKSDEDKKALATIAAEAFTDDEAKNYIKKFFHLEKLNVLHLRTIHEEGFKVMNDGEKLLDYNYANLRLSAPGCKTPKQIIKLPILRMDRGMTQKQLAEKSGVCISQIARIENGTFLTPNITAGTLQKLSVALGCKMEELL